MQFTAQAFDQFGQPIMNATITFASDNTNVATVDSVTTDPSTGIATATVTGHNQGNAHIAAQAMSGTTTVKSQQATLTVNPPTPTLTSVTISPPSATIDAGQTEQFTAQAFDQFGQPIGGVTISFTSSNTTVATVDSVSATSGTGSATATIAAHTNGSADIKATANDGTKTVTGNAATLTVAHVFNAGDVLISEFRTRGPAGAADEFIELYNPTNSTVPIGGLKIRASNATGTVSDRVTITSGVTLGSGCHYLVANSSYTGSVAPNQTYGTGITDDGGIAITQADGTTIIDQVGMSSGSAYKEGATLAALSANVNQSYERKPGGASGNGTDTNNNGADFFLNSSSSNPQNSSSGCLDLSTADLGITNVDSPDPVTTGSHVTYTITITNSGPGTAQSVVVTDNLPSNLFFVSCSSTGAGVCAGTGNNRTVTFSSLASGASATITIVANANGAGGTTITNRASVASSTTDPNSGNNSANATTDIQEALPTLSIDDVTVAEGDAGTKIVDFTVTLSAASTHTVTVDYSTADGNATARSDYQSASGTLAFNAGETQKTITITINGDTLVEPDETFSVNLSNPTNALITDDKGQGTITNDDTANLVISQIYQGGGLTNTTYTNDFVEIFNRGTTTVDFSVTPFSIQFLSTVGSTWTKTDLTTKTIAPGQYFLIQETSGGSAGAPLPTPDATGTINITSTTPGKVALVYGTTLLTGNCPGDDGTQPFNPSVSTIVDFIGYGGTLSTANHCYEGSGPAPYTTGNNAIADFRKSGGCTDTNNNASDFFAYAPSPRNTSSPLNNCTAGAPPNLSINDVQVTEGNSGTVTATFTVSLSAPSPSTDVTFDIATQDNTATTANRDYVAKSLTNQVIPAGQQTYTFSVTVNGDTLVEPDETFFVNVSNVSGANVTKSQGVGTIKNDDLPSLSITDVSQNEGDAGTTTFTFTVNLSAPAPADVTFDIATADGTATTVNNDYVANSLATQKIIAGQQSYNFNVTVNGDTLVEPDETFFVNVSNVAGATLSKGQGTGTILNDDSPILSINNVQMNEGNSSTTTFTFTVSLSTASNQTVTVNYATADNTATIAGNDYQSASGTLTFNPGETQKTINVLVNGDTLVEPDESFFVSLSGASGANVGTGQGIGTIQNDDTANLVISQVYGGGNNSGATYQNDYIELFNRGTTTVDFHATHYSVQYAGATSAFGATNTKTDITSGTIAPGHYFLIQESGGTTNGISLPAPDLTGGNINLSATAGKVALVNGTAALSATTCPGDDGNPPFNPNSATIVDFVGYGSSANCYEGMRPTSAPSNTSADFRKAGGCTDSNDNAADFVVATPNPRNTSSETNNCDGSTNPNLSINDVSMSEGNGGTTTFTFTVSLSAATTSDVNFDIATEDNTATVADNDYLAQSLTGQVIPAGQQTYTFGVTINGDKKVETNETFNVNVTNVTNATVSKSQGAGTIQNDDGIVISQIYGGGGNSGSTIKNDFVELFNRSTTTIDISAWSVQYISATATTGSYSVTNLCSSTTAGTCTIAPGHFYLVKLGGGSNGTIDLQGDATGTTDMAATAGKVALVINRTQLSATSCQAASASVVDYVGYGSTANCSEGAVAPAPSNTNAIQRRSNGCQDTDSNSSDFATGSPNPRNSATTANVCP